MSSSHSLIGTGLLSLLTLIVFQDSALGDESRTRGHSGEKPIVLSNDATPQWTPATQRLVTQVPEKSPRVVTTGEDERGTALVIAADEQAWTL